MLAEKKIYLDRTSIYVNLRKAFEGYPDKYRLVYNGNQILPFIHCTNCKIFRYFYKQAPNDKVRNNSRTNVVNHVCVSAPDNPILPNYARPVAMKLPDRQAITSIISEQIGKYPTMSIQATTDFFNSTLQQIQSIILNNGHPVIFDISRKKVGQNIIKIGQNIKNSNIEFLNNNLGSSCLVFDHWSKHGKNFFAAIARTVKPDLSFVENVVGFFVASTNKTAAGYLEDLEKLLTKNPKFKIPLMSDNCSTMLKVNKISDQFKKIQCAAHKLATINDKIHKLPQVAELDSTLTKINAYFNYRHFKFDLPLKPQTSKSTTRSWRSHSENYLISLRNFDRYEELFMNKSDFPKLPCKFLLRKMSEYQQRLSEFFDILERKDSDLLDQLDVYEKLLRLSTNSTCTNLFGNHFVDLVKKQSTIQAFLSDDTLAYCYLSKIKFDFVFKDFTFIDSTELVNKAKLRIKYLAKQFENDSQQVSGIQVQVDSSRAHTNRLFEQNVPSNIEPEDPYADLFDEFESIKDGDRAGFWQKNGKRLKVLLKVYMHLRSIPASNSSIERSFSLAGRIFDELKSSTSEDSIEAQVVLCMDRALDCLDVVVMDEI